jgi:hypothetical protein
MDTFNFHDILFRQLSFFDFEGHQIKKLKIIPFNRYTHQKSIEQEGMNTRTGWRKKNERKRTEKRKVSLEEK